MESDGVDALPIYFVPELAAKWKHTAPFLESLLFVYNCYEAISTLSDAVDIYDTCSGAYDAYAAAEYLTSNSDYDSD